MTALDKGLNPNTGGERVLFEGRPAVFANIGAVLLTGLTLGIAALVYWFRSLGRSYRITTQRIVVEQGVLSKRIEQIDLGRVNDFVVELPLGQRIMGTGNLVVQSIDKTTPEIRLHGLKADVRRLYEEVRAAAEIARRERGVRVVEYE